MPLDLAMRDHFPRHLHSYLRDSTLRRVPHCYWPGDTPDTIAEVWLSSVAMVQVHVDRVGQEEVVRLSILSPFKFIDGDGGVFSWETLQQLKRECGYGDHDAVEVYPRDCDVVNVANMRHLFLIDGLPFVWRRKEQT